MGNTKLCYKYITTYNSVHYISTTFRFNPLTSGFLNPDGTLPGIDVSFTSVILCAKRGMTSPSLTFTGNTIYGTSVFKSLSANAAIYEQQ